MKITSMLISICVAILTILIAPLQQGETNCTIATSDLVTSLNIAQSTTKCLYIPMGIYIVQPGTLLVATNYIAIHGAGIGKTILKLPDDLVINTRTYVIRFTAAYQSIRDLSIIGGSNPSGTNAMLGISLENGATYTHIQRVEISALYGGNTAGASGIDLYQLWSNDNANQHALVENCIIHDMPNASGIVINSSGNTIRNNIIKDVGNSFVRHGIYMQGGYNLVNDNIIERVGGYSLHAWQKVQSIDGSGNIYRNNISINPGFQHMIVSGLSSNGTNPAIPNGQQLTRTATISGNTFRNTGLLKRTGIVTDIPAIIENNTFEDVVADGSAVIRITATAGGSIVRGNAIRAFQPAITNGGAIILNTAAIVDGNSIDTKGLNYAIGTIPVGAVVSDNLIYKSQ